MNALLWLLVLAFAWVAVNGTLTWYTLASGMAIGAVVLIFVRRSEVDYLRRGWALLTFALYFIKELVLANLRVARDVLSPRPRISPGVIAIPLDLHTDIQVTVLANIITLTPGTLSLDIDSERSVLYIHAMYAADPEEVRRSVKEGFERRVRELAR